MIEIKTRKRIKTSIVLLFLAFLMFKFEFIFIYSLITLGVFTLLEFFQLTKKIINKSINRFFINSIFILYVIIFCYLLFFLNKFIFLKILLFIILLGCVSSDIGGFVFGKLLRGPKLIKISPNKTYSGAIGSIIFTCLVISSLMYLITESTSLKILIVSFITSIGCQIGDLFFSFLKRKAKIKDTGSIFPGHGGVLDRLDSILLGFPLGYVSLMIFL